MTKNVATFINIQNSSLDEFVFLIDNTYQFLIDDTHELRIADYELGSTFTNIAKN